MAWHGIIEDGSQSHRMPKVRYDVVVFNEREHCMIILSLLVLYGMTVQKGQQRKSTGYLSLEITQAGGTSRSATRLKREDWRLDSRAILEED
jgi:hypothetical protein